MSDWEPTGTKVIRQEVCGLSQVRRIAAMLDQEPDNWNLGDVLPRGWQFIMLGADTKRSELRSDGFPGLGVPLPDLGLPQLVLGGRTVSFLGDIIVGEPYRRESVVQSVKHKETNTGPLAIVTIAHELYAQTSNSPTLSETQTYILMSSRSAKAPAPAAPPDLSGATIQEVVPDDTLLFQYSALGFNSHRIHIDRTYAREVDGYPDLVVNGGLATLLLTDFLRTELGHQVSALKTRHLAPLLCGRTITLAARKSENGWSLQAYDEEGRLAVDIDATMFLIA